MIKQSIADAVLREALKTGGDFAELFVEDRESLSLSSLDGRVENVSKRRGYGAGIRILKGTRSVYAYANDSSEEALLKSAREAAAALGAAEATGGEDIVFATSVHKNRNPIEIYPNQVKQKDIVALMGKAYAVAKGASAEIAQVSVGYADVDQRVLVCNSEGLWAEDRRVRTRFSVQAVAAGDGEFETGYNAPGRSMGYEIFRQEVDPEECARIASKQALTMLHAEKCPSGVVPVVIDGGFGGVIFHEACGHSLEATAVGKGNSVFCNKLGEKIASDKVTAIDDGTLENAWGALSMDDEGMATQKNVLIESGVLKGYLIDRLGSRRMDMAPTGSGRREGYSYAPTSRMNNTYIAPGQDDEQEMLDSMTEGLFAKSMGGGSVNPLTGEFNFSVQEGYWVKNGDLRPVRGATLIGKGAEILPKIDRVGPRMWLAAGMCGSVSGSIPVNVGQPRIRVSSMIVGGAGAEVNGGE